jgi:hypothetical protein
MRGFRKGQFKWAFFTICRASRRGCTICWIDRRDVRHRGLDRQVTHIGRSCCASQRGWLVRWGCTINGGV